MKVNSIKIYTGKDDEYEPTKITNGDRIFCHKEHKTIKIVRGEATPILWPNGRSRREARYIRNESDFCNVALLIAATNGKFIKRLDSCNENYWCYIFLDTL